ncbi:MAG TPA: ANTAR domain-containing protein [Clostridia bacterium]
MAGEKYVVAAADNSTQISIRNILNPNGFVFLGNCSDFTSLMRLIRSYSPDFAVIDLSMPSRDFHKTLETIDDEMLCSLIAIGDYNDIDAGNLLKFKTLSICTKPLVRELLINTVEMAIISYKRIYALDKKLKEMTESYETRKVVDRAKWILIERDGISENEAYEKMRKKSMDTRLSMKAIADAIIFTYEITNKKKG